MIRLKHLRTIPDPEFPGEDEVLFFVMVKFNMDDIKELKRVTQIELSGQLDQDGLKAFVEASWYIWFFVTIYDARNLQSISEPPKQNNHNHPMKKTYTFCI